MTKNIIEIPPIQTQEMVELSKEKDTNVKILQEARKLKIDSDEDYEFVSLFLREVKSQNKSLEERKKRATDPLNAVLKEIRSWFKPPQDILVQIESHLKKLIQCSIMSKHVWLSLMADFMNISPKSIPSS